MDSRFLPWDDDEIVFLSGDFTIERADISGLYRYSINGIMPRVAVDAVQLLEWGMAEPVRYELLEPFDSENITYKDVDILRDITLGEIGLPYIIQDGKKLLRVNKFYLVKHGLADGDEKFVREVNKSKPKGKYNKKCKPWPSDNILILPAGDNVVERAAAEGLYMVKLAAGGTVSWGADRLVEKGYAIDAYDIKLDSLCESSKLTFAEYGEELFGYWRHDNPSEVKSVRDIAKLWRELQTLTGKAYERIISYNAGITAKLRDAESIIAVFNERCSNLETEIKTYQDSIGKIKNKLDNFKAFGDKQIGESLDGYDGQADWLRKLFEKADLNNVTVLGLLNSCYDIVCDAVPGDEADDMHPDLIPTEILPSELVAQIRATYDYINNFGESFEDMCDECQQRLESKRVQVVEMDDKLLKFKDEFADINAHITWYRQRIAQLNSARERLSCTKAWKKGPPLFHKKNKSGTLQFTTGVKIIERYGDGYDVEDGNEYLRVTAKELLYLGLAEVL